MEMAWVMCWNEGNRGGARERSFEEELYRIVSVAAVYFNKGTHTNRIQEVL